jgi:pimeloyl-ACP methyl ester carboxylesterase
MKINKKLIAFLVLVVAIAAPYFYFDSESRELTPEVRAALPGNFIQLADGVTHYEIAGPETGQPVVFVHGFSVPYFIWDKNFAPVVEAGFRVVRYDLFGRGYSDRPKAAYDLELFDRQLSGLIDALGINGRVDLVGLSMGGPIVANFAARHPEKIRRLVFVDPGGLSPASASLADRVIRAPLIGEYLMQLTGDRSLPEGQRTDFLKAESCPPDYLDRYRDQMRYKGFKRAILSTIRHVNWADVPAIFARVGQQNSPVLLIWGREDRTTPIGASGSFLERIPHAEFIVIEEAAHLPQLEKSELVNPLIVDFLKR